MAVAVAIIVPSHFPRCGIHDAVTRFERMPNKSPGRWFSTAGTCGSVAVSCVEIPKLQGLRKIASLFDTHALGIYLELRGLVYEK